MPITQMLKEAKDRGETTVIVTDGVFCMTWIDGPRNTPKQIWMFLPR